MYYTIIDIYVKGMIVTQIPNSNTRISVDRREIMEKH